MIDAKASKARLVSLYGGRTRVAHFPARIAECFPHNSSPHRVSRTEFLGFFQQDARRVVLARALEVFLDAISGQVVVPGLLISGSYLDLANPHPNDLDGVLLYAVRKSQHVDWPSFNASLRQARRSGIDLRPVPVDGDPLLLVQVISFMTSLYLSQRDTNAFANHGMLLVAWDHVSTESN